MLSLHITAIPIIPAKNSNSANSALKKLERTDSNSIYLKDNHFAYGCWSWQWLELFFGKIENSKKYACWPWKIISHFEIELRMHFIFKLFRVNLMCGDYKLSVYGWKSWVRRDFGFHLENYFLTWVTSDFFVLVMNTLETYLLFLQLWWNAAGEKFILSLNFHVV